MQKNLKDNLKNKPKDNALLGALLMLTCQFFSASILTAVKVISANLSTLTIAFVNYAVCLTLVCLTIMYSKDKTTIKTKYWPLHIIRSLSGCAYFITLFLALRFIPAVDGMLLRSTAPIWAPIIALICLKQTIKKNIWLGILTGFIGVALILHPNLSGLNPGYFLALLSGISFACNGLLTRALGARGEPSLRILFYAFLIPTLLLAPYAFNHWPHHLSQHDILLLTGISVGTYFMFFFWVGSLRYAKVTVTLPLSYVGVLIAGIYDWLLWQHIPSIFSIIGMLLIFLSCSYVVISQHRNG